ncbi:LPS-assembly protein LptD [Puniceibacterium sp. IMCC21224]|uniref:LPS-assembly protein LptD n=1 Tax=Puniceibacterium sp. IMCC21224 TaxID=1618204 RepID=UPI00064D8E63|nr:LPS assembly protein LptD [Puniceibacterium sp. IMCC21224]KMK67601.1 organic solvent tolerance protein OstA [Puniceibacterium sp. IMCC21224]
MRRLIALFWLLATPLAAQQNDAQPDAALLIADLVQVEGETRLIASGNVEALYDGTRLTATQIVYDSETDRLTLTGPIRITDPQGNVLVADSGQIDSGIENGLLNGARMVLDEQLQIASVEARRVGGRYTQLSRVAVTSCQVCGDTSAPLWQIRATRVVHDQLERQLYFENATLRVLDVPVFYIPYMRLPDPTLDRARGFLIPSIRSTTLLGFGIKTPYFIPIGDHQDITLTPYLSQETRTLEARYRRAFRNGAIELNGALTQDTLIPQDTRGYFFAEGLFDLPRDFKLSFSIETSSDEAYLNDYDYSGADRLESELVISRVRRDEYISGGIIHYNSLLDGDSNATQPSIITDLQYERRLFPRRIGGELRFSAVAHNHYRYSDDDVDGTDDDSIVDGRDVTRLTTDISWRDRWTLPGGIRAGALGQLWVDRFWINQDATSPNDVSQVTPAASVELRWPWTKSGTDGAHYLIEPVAQLGWVGGDRLNVPNDESTRSEFSEGNLLSLSRFAAPDRRERGRLSALGVRFLRDDPDGWAAGLTLGRVWHEEYDSAFSRSSGLSNTTSDFLVAGHLATQDGLRFSARGLFDTDNLRIDKAEARAGWANDRMDLTASYVLLVTDPDEDRDQAVSEWTFEGRYEFTPRWAAETEVRYDLADKRYDKAALDIEYQNECAQVTFSVSRKFASSTNLEPSTDFGLTVALKGFSTGGSAKEYRRSCSTR